jgi:predicted RecB family nuclease
VLGKPEMPTARIRIYVDIEGNPDEGFIYLIGVIICDGERVERHSFWADTKNEEAAIFNQLLSIVSRYVRESIATAVTRKRLSCAYGEICGARSMSTLCLLR